MRPETVGVGGGLGASDPLWSTTLGAPARGQDVG